MQDQKIRLQKMLADCGVASRRKAEELIQQGKVKVNGHVAQIGDKVNPKTDHVTVAGRRIVASRQYYYIMLHKPRRSWLRISRQGFIPWAGWTGIRRACC